MGETFWIDAAGAAMWALVERYTGHVGYERGTKAGGLEAEPPVIDCSGWVALLLATGMAAANRAALNREVGVCPFSDADMAAVHTWSDRQIANLERRSGFILTGDQITVDGLPPYATIGLQQGGGGWASNHARPRGITHVVQIVHRPGDPVPHVSEAQGMSRPYGIRLLALPE